MSERQRKIKEWAVTILIAACLIAMAAMVIGLVALLMYDAQLFSEHTELCYSNGYSEYRSGYCYRLVDGTEELVSIGNLR